MARLKRRSARHSTNPGGVEVRGKPGDAPGTLAPDPEPEESRVRRFVYDEANVRVDAPRLDAIGPSTDGDVTWVDVQGYSDLRGLEALARTLGVHPLALEDALQPGQRPKVERYGADVFLVLRMLGQQDGHVGGDQVSIYLKGRLVVTFQEHRDVDCLDPVRERIRHGRGRIRLGGADYLLYALVDAVVDFYFPLLEALGERIEALEDSALGTPGVAFAEEVRGLRGDLLTMRRVLWPLREAVTQLTETEVDAFEPETLIYFRDCRDHVLHALDTVESYRETASGLIDVQLSRSSHELAEVTKVLTIIATVFMPMTFVAGIYGMNFDPRSSPYNMPELSARYGYPMALGLMALIGVAMLLFFVRRGWLGSEAGRRRRSRDHRRGPG